LRIVVWLGQECNYGSCWWQARYSTLLVCCLSFDLLQPVYTSFWGLWVSQVRMLGFEDHLLHERPNFCSDFLGFGPSNMNFAWISSIYAVTLLFYLIKYWTFFNEFFYGETRKVEMCFWRLLDVTVCNLKWEVCVILLCGWDSHRSEILGVTKPNLLCTRLG
jgi:hypothetical protein